MGLIDAIKTWLAPAPASASRFVEASGFSIDPDEENWRALSGDSKRNLSPLTQRRMQELAVYLWKTNPLANRLIELPVAYLLAEGVTLNVPDEEAQAWLNAFWRDPVNRMDIKLPKKVRELALYGEQCWPTFVNEINGHVRLGYLDPALIETIVTDPDNIEQPIGVVTCRDKKGKKRRYRVIVNGPETVFSEATQKIRETFTDGECFYFTVNDLSNASRGHSDLLAQMDWLDGYDHALFGELERWDFMRAFIYDVTLKGATPEEVKKRAGEITPPAPGSVRVHNDSEVWESVTPDLKATDSDSIARLFRNHVMGGATIPEHWYGGGGDVNRATAGEMGEPTFKIFTMRQTFLGYILCEIGYYQIRQRLKALYGSEPEQSEDVEAYRVKAQFPELTARDTASYATAFGQVVIAAAAAIDRGLLSEATAVGLIALIAGQLGMKIDAVEELEKAKVDATRRTEADTFPGFDPTSEDRAVADASDASNENAPPPAPAADGGNIQQTALTGVQITAALEIIGKVAKGELPRDTGIAMLQQFFQLTEEAAGAIMGEVGKTFLIKERDEPPSGGLPAGQGA